MKNQGSGREKPEQKEKNKKQATYKYKPEDLAHVDTAATRRGESVPVFMEQLSNLDVIYRLGNDKYLASIDPDDTPEIIISLSRKFLGRARKDLSAPFTRITPAMMDLLCTYSSMTSILYAARRIIEKKQEDDPAAAEKFKDVVLAAVCIQDEIEKALGPNSFDLFKMFLVKREKANRGAVEEAAVETPAGPAGPC